MIRSLLPLLLAATLIACDSAVEPPTSEVSVGATYSGSTLALRDVHTRSLVYDYLANGAEIEVRFRDADSFEARLFVPYEALVASGETDDLDGDIEQDLAGSYTQRDGALMFTADATPGEFVDSFFTDEGWTISADGRSIQYGDYDSSNRVDVVLTRR